MTFQGQFGDSGGRLGLEAQFFCCVISSCASRTTESSSAVPLESWDRSAILGVRQMSLHRVGDLGPGQPVLVSQEDDESQDSPFL